MTDNPRILILGGGFAALRFGAGEPFHAGAGWKAMDVGLKGMAGMLAD